MEQLSLNPKLLKLLSVFVFNPNQSFYVRELAKKNLLPVSTTSRLLDKLLNQQILQFTTKGSLKLFQLNLNHPSLPEIKSLAQKELGQISLLTQALKQIPLVSSVTVYGSAANNQLTSTSDIDLLIVGKPPVDELNQQLNRLEKTLSREINYSLYSPEEFSRQKIKPGFLKYILQQPHQTIINNLWI